MAEEVPRGSPRLDAHRCARAAVRRSVPIRRRLALHGPDKIWFTHIDVAGNLLVVTKNQVVALHADSGKPIWTLRFDTEARVFRNVLDAYVLFGYGHTLLALDPITGDTVWHRSDLPDLSQTSLFTPRGTHGLVQTESGFAVLDLPSGRTLWDSLALPPHTVVREYFPLRDHNLLVVLARTPRSEIALLGVTLDSGRVRWQHDSLFPSKLEFRRDRRGVEFLSDYQLPRPPRAGPAVVRRAVTRVRHRPGDGGGV
jgi:hypothetical protein